MDATSPDHLSPRVFVEALSGARSRITDRQWAMLQAHFLAADRLLTTSELSAAAGTPDYRAANLQYGRLGSLLRKYSPELHALPGQRSYAIASFLPPDGVNMHWRWSMHLSLFLALDQLGWFCDDLAVATPSDFESIAAREAQLVQRLVWHRHRERSLRFAKLLQARKQGDGRLVCEVPGCGFDFARVYGPLGEGYAEVHHRRPLSKLEPGQETALADLAVICSNCHRMIHRGGECRSLEELFHGIGDAIQHAGQHGRLATSAASPPTRASRRLPSR